MISKKAILLLVICAFYSFASVAQNSAQPNNSGKPEVVTIVADLWCPYNCEPTSYNPGFMIEIAREALAEKNIEIQYSNIPWARAIEETRKGSYTAIVGAAKGDAEDFIFPDVPQAVSRNIFYVRAGETWQYKGVNSLKEKILAVIEDYDYGEEMKNYIAENKNNNTRIQSVSGEDALAINIKKLLNRRVDVIIENEAVMQGSLQKMALQDKIAPAGGLNMEDDLYLAFSPKNSKSSEYAKIISEGTKKMRETGRLQEILDKYNVKDWQK